jgi:hypothetical protein
MPVFLETSKTSYHFLVGVTTAERPEGGLRFWDAGASVFGVMGRLSLAGSGSGTYFMPPLDVFVLPGYIFAPLSQLEPI